MTIIGGNLPITGRIGVPGGTCRDEFDRTTYPLSDPFTRLVASGFGQSPLGAAWAANPSVNSVDGANAVFSGGSGSVGASLTLTLTYPIEVVVQWRFVGSGTLDQDFKLSLWDPSFSSEIAAGRYFKDFVGGVDFSKVIASHETTTDNPHSQTVTAPAAAPYGTYMRMRILVTATETKVRVWAATATEPSVWHATATGSVAHAAKGGIVMNATWTTGNSVSVDYIYFEQGLAQPHGWGVGPLGTWTDFGDAWVNSGAGYLASGAGSSLLVDQWGAGVLPSQNIELLMKFHVDEPAAIGWALDILVGDGPNGISADNATGMTLQWTSSFGGTPLMGDYDSRGGFSGFERYPQGIPNPTTGVELMWRLLIDRWGVYSRVWRASDPELTSFGTSFQTPYPNVPYPDAGRGESWHAWRTSGPVPTGPTIDPPYSWISIIGSSRSITVVDWLEIVTPCQGSGGSGLKGKVVLA